MGAAADRRTRSPASRRPQPVGWGLGRAIKATRASWARIQSSWRLRSRRDGSGGGRVASQAEGRRCCRGTVARGGAVEAELMPERSWGPVDTPSLLSYSFCTILSARLGQRSQISTPIDPRPGFSSTVSHRNFFLGTASPDRRGRHISHSYPRKTGAPNERQVLAFCSCTHRAQSSARSTGIATGVP